MTDLKALRDAICSIEALAAAGASIPTVLGAVRRPEPPVDPRLAALRDIFGTFVIEENEAGIEHGFRVQPEKDVTAAVVARVVQVLGCAPEALVVKLERVFSGCNGSCCGGGSEEDWLSFEVRA